MKITSTLRGGGGSYLDFLCGLQYNAPTARQRLTKIVCTIGPASRTVEMLEELMSKGMNIARMNFSHGAHEYHAETVSNVRQAAQNYSKKLSFEYPIAIALDTKGPEIRTGLVEGSATGEADLKMGEAIKLTPNEQYREKCTKEVVYVDYANILEIVKPGNHIYVDDGLISLIVDKVDGDMVHCKIANGGKLGSQKGVNLPGLAVDLPAVSEKDKKDLEFGVEQDVDMVFASFIRNAEALHTIRDVLGYKGQDIKVISKIENHEGIQNINAIIDASDGIMVARGDMGIEIPIESVSVAQKTIIARCNRAGKPVICATQMLESMTKAPRPTRAESSDVVNAVLDGSDCVMLSGETAKGSYPSECVTTMANICKQAESIAWYPEQFNDLVRSSNETCPNSDGAMAIAVVQASYQIAAAAILIVTITGQSAYHVSRYRPKCPIIMVTDCRQTARQAQLYRGIVPYFFGGTSKKDSSNKKLDERLAYGLDCAKKQSFVECGDTIIVLVPPEDESSFAQNVSIRTVD